jgi:4-diphosphocytidyl-2-C-methyl-D-erythritol kinase
MLIRRRDSSIRVWAPAKVNLHLEVLGRRADGYHELATLLVAVSLYDTLEFTEAPGGTLQLLCDHPGLPTGPDNLVWRAADLLRRRSGHPGGAVVRLWKRIPHAAGLAGGSSDAAATLAGLNRLWRLGLRREALAELGAELGSDIPFFFSTPAAWCTGRGERVERVVVGRPLHLVLAKPEQGLSTAAVFGALDGGEKGGSVPPERGRQVREALAAGDVDQLGRLLHNDLQGPAEKLCPEVARLREALAGLGPAGQLMSGSGSTVFALCRDAAEAVRIGRAFNRLQDERGGARTCVVRSCD